MTLSIIIVSYNVKYYLEQCLHSVWAAARDIDTEVFVVDNCSTDGSLAYLSRRFPQTDYPNLHFIENTHNVGFGRANNQAAAQATGRYVLFLNPDTVLTDTTLTDCLAFADQHPELGALGVRMLKSNGQFAYESRRGLPTPWTAFCKMCGLCQLFPKSRLFGRYYMRYLDATRPNAIEITSGAFMMAPRAALDRSGLFDEDFFMYGEDIDLSYRLIKNGFTNYYIPTPILHYKGESTQKSSYRYVHVFYRAMLIFFNKHYRHYGFWLSLPIQAAIYFRAIIAMLQQASDHFRRLLTLGEREPEVRMLFLGSPANIDRVKRLNQTWQLSLDYVAVNRCNDLPRGHLDLHRDLSPYQYIVYDTSLFCYVDIFRIFAEDKAGKRQMGFYSPQTEVLTTNAMALT